MSSLSLHVVTNGKMGLDQVIECVRSFPQAGVDVLHIREKHRTARELYNWANELKQWSESNGNHVKIHINDRVDAAVAVNADGIHLAYHSLPLTEVKSMVSPSMCVGISVHSLEEALAAVRNGADYILFGHIYSTVSKLGLVPRGVAQLKQIVDSVSIPVLAIGGIDESNLAEVIGTGCAGIAVMSSIWNDPNPAERVSILRWHLDQLV